MFLHEAERAFMHQAFGAAEHRYSNIVCKYCSRKTSPLHNCNSPDSKLNKPMPRKGLHFLAHPTISREAVIRHEDLPNFIDHDHHVFNVHLPQTRCSNFRLSESRSLSSLCNFHVIREEGCQHRVFTSCHTNVHPNTRRQMEINYCNSLIKMLKGKDIPCGAVIQPPPQSLCQKWQTTRQTSPQTKTPQATGS